MKKMSLAARIIILPIATAGAMALIFLYVIPYTNNLLLDEKKARVEHLVECAVSLIAHFQNLQAKKNIEARSGPKKKRSRRLRNCATRGINIFGLMTLSQNDHAPLQSAVERKDISNITDPEGKRLFCGDGERGKGAQKGGGELFMAQTRQEKPAPKISYVQEVPGWKWIVGTGIYVDDVNREMNSYIIRISTVVGLVFLVVLLVGLRASLKISRTVKQAVAVLDEGSKQVAAASKELSDGSQSLAQMSSEQAASIEQTSALLEEILAAAKRTAEITQGQSDMMQENITKSCRTIEVLGRPGGRDKPG